MIGSADCGDGTGGKRGREEGRGCGEIVRLHGERHEAVILRDVAFQNIGART